MKAMLLKGPGRIEAAELPEPSCPLDGLILQVKACGLCGGDIRTFNHGNSIPGGTEIMGHEVTGMVVAVGANAVGDFKEGDRLALAADIRCDACYYCRQALPNLCLNLKILGKHVDGGFVEYMVLTDEILRRGIVHFLPAELDFVQGALSEPLSSVLSSHDFLGVGFGQTVVIIGAGPMGCLHAALARARGAFKVILAEKSRLRLALAEQVLARVGIDCFLNPDEVDLEAAVREMTGGLGADIVIVACPAPEVPGQAVRLVKRRGTVGVFGGFPRGRDRLEIDGNILHYGEIRLVGNFSYHPRYHRLSLETLAARVIDPDPFITVYPLTELAQAIGDANQGKVLKAVLVP
ncbi:MAG: alcohol dehydrogenase catalytic domain-containing protein [Bacillota bacterium]